MLNAIVHVLSWPARGDECSVPLYMSYHGQPEEMDAQCHCTCPIMASQRRWMLSAIVHVLCIVPGPAATSVASGASQYKHSNQSVAKAL